MRFRVINTSNGRILADRAEQAGTFLHRFRGLIGRGQLQRGEGLLLVPCNAIHTFFLRVPIDAAFLDPDHRVIETIAGLLPWRATRAIRGARSVLELPAGTLAATLTGRGDELAFELC